MWRRRKRPDPAAANPGPAPGADPAELDAALAVRMRENAEVLLTMAGSHEGWRFAWGPESVPELAQFIGQAESEQAVGALPHLGAYFGELLVRNGGGSWTWDPAADLPAVRTATGFLLFPHDVVERSVTDLFAAPLGEVYTYAMAGYPAPSPEDGVSPGYFSAVLQDRPLDVRDIDLGHEMRCFATIFVHNASLYGYRLGGDEESLTEVERICEELIEGDPDPEVLEDMVDTLGPYLGEVVNATAGGHWEASPDDEYPLVLVLPGGVRAHPHDRAWKRLTQGPGHDLPGFYRRAVAGDSSDEDVTAP